MEKTLNSGAILQGGKYEIIRTLGKGGFGITYEAIQVKLRRKVAIKEFFMQEYCEREESSDAVTLGTKGSSRDLVDRFRSKFVREAQMIADMDHPNIVKIHDVFEENDTAYYVMEYLGGGSLKSLVKERGPLPEGNAINYIRQAGSALSYIHSRKSLHFDVKPDNIMLNKEGRAVLIDFGVSKHYDDAGSQTSSTPVGISKGYAPLEQYQTAEIATFTPATDVYSLGATLYKLVSGLEPPSASEVNEDGVPYISGIAAITMKAIEAAMQPRRKDRPQSVEAFLSMLGADAAERPGKLSSNSLNDSAKVSGPSVVADDETTVITGNGFTGGNSSKRELKAETKPVPNPKSGLNKGLLFGIAGAVAAAVLAFLILNIGGGKGSSLAPIADTLAVSNVVEEPSKTEPVVNEVPARVELKSIQLSKSSLELTEGESASLTVKFTPSNATDKEVKWESTDAKVVTVSQKGKVTAVKAGSASVVASASGVKNVYCNVTVKGKEKPAAPLQQNSSNSTQQSSGTGSLNGHDWVDLGLSVKWATCNVGASNESDYGSYFAWGEISPKSEYTWSNLKYCLDSNGDRFSKYVASSSYGNVDNRTRLEYSDDAARYNWGGRWRMPTESEFEELINKCKWEWTTRGGHNGYLVTGPSGRSIFLPAAGWRTGSSSSSVGSLGYYWSSTLTSSYSLNARYFYFNSGYDFVSSSNRYDGQSVRPVVSE